MGVGTIRNDDAYRGLQANHQESETEGLVGLQPLNTDADESRIPVNLI
jgi:hypothetical protein